MTAYRGPEDVISNTDRRPRPYPGRTTGRGSYTGRVKPIGEQTTANVSAAARQAAGRPRGYQWRHRARRQLSFAAAADNVIRVLLILLLASLLTGAVLVVANLDRFLPAAVCPVPAQVSAP